jgi:uncharacterized SAM-binding protein YcdF (DUF218 family)
MSILSHDTAHAAALHLWNYHLLSEPLQPADGILVFGSNDLRVADYAASLYQRGMAPWIMFTGARGRMTEQWPDTEAACFAARARDLGVPDSSIYCEPHATHTGENIAFSRQLIREHNLMANRVIVLQKPYMERRTRASIETQWPELNFRVSSPLICFEQYPNEFITMDDLIHAMVGDFFRIIDYPQKGLSSKQEVPDSVWDAYRLLIDAGYTGQLPA